MPIAQAERIVRATLENIADWERRLGEIERHAVPFTGNKARALELMRDMETAKRALQRVLDDLNPG